MKVIKRKIKQFLFHALQPYGFSVDGIKGAGYISKEDRHFKKFGFDDLRSYFEHKWQSNVQERCQQYVAHFFAPRLKGTEKFVEIGTGVGFVTKCLFDHFPNICVYSFELDKFLENYLNHEFKNFNFHTMPCDGKSLQSMQTNSAQGVVAFGVFTYLNFSNIVHYLDEIARVCQSGAWLLFDIFDTDLQSDELVSNFEYHARKNDNRPFISGTLLQKILKKLNFELIEIYQDKTGFYSTKFLYQKKYSQTS